MSGANTRPSDRAVLVAVLNPISQAAATVTTGWISMVTFDSIQAIVFAGVLGASATVDAKLEQATTSGGAGAKDITGKAITQLTKAGTDDNKQAIINCRADELDITNSFAFVRLSLTVGTAASLISAAVFGHDARYQPADDATTVDSVIG